MHNGLVVVAETWSMTKSKAATGRKPDSTASRSEDRYNEVLVALRQIIRATDLHSKNLQRTSGLTVPQIVVLQSIDDLGEVTTGLISNRVNLSQATVTTILDRLEKRALIERYRSLSDRRVVHARLTKRGRSELRNAPPLLHERFIREFSELTPKKQQQMIDTLNDVAELLGAETLDAAPLLDTASPLAQDIADEKP